MAQVKLTIDKDKVLANLTDYVVYVDLSDMTSTFWDTVANGGGDIRVYKSDGTTELAREVVSCDTSTDTGELHFKYTGTLSSSSDTEVIIDVDGARSDYAVGATYGRNAVWSDYFGVWHEGAGTDSTGNGRTGTANGGVTNGGATGQIGEGTDYDGSDDYNSLANMSTLEDILAQVTFQSWVSADSDAFYTAFGGVEDGSSETAYVIFEFNGGPSGTSSDERIAFLRNQNGDACRIGVTDATMATITTGNLNYLVTTLDINTSGNNKFYLNGSDATDSFTTDSMSDNFQTTDQSPYIGARNLRGVVSANLDGVIDDFRIRSGVLSSDWVGTEYNNQDSPSTFYSVEDILSSSRRRAGFVSFF